MGSARFVKAMKVSGKPLRTGYSTGACSAAAVKAAVLVMTGSDVPGQVEITLANGERVTMPVKTAFVTHDKHGYGTIVKDAGDDPDITNGCKVSADVFWADEGDIFFEAGEGVGIVTKDGLSIPKGEPAINPGPRAMITNALREVTARPVRVRISIPGGEELAKKTFNPRLGVVGGLSILGTTGIVRPFSNSAVRASIVCLMNVALTAGYTSLIFTPGNIGMRAAVGLFNVALERIVEVGNEWGYMIDKAVEKGVTRLSIVGHPGKLAKLPLGYWQTHSKNSPIATQFISETAQNELGIKTVESETLEGIFEALTFSKRKALANRTAEKIGKAIENRTRGKIRVSVALVNMKSELIGQYGEIDV